MFIVTLWMGCSESNFSYPKPIEVCASQYWADEAAPAPTDDPRWTLREKWVAHVGGGFLTEMSGAAFVDTNGDGEVGLGDRIDLVVKTDGHLGSSSVWYIDASTGASTQLLEDSWFDGAFTIAEVDPGHPGPEIIHAFEGTASLAGPDGVYLQVAVPDMKDGYGLMISDLEGDGAFELINRQGVFALDTGEKRFDFDPRTGTAPAVADLDGDGQEEIVVHGYQGMTGLILDPRGEVVAKLAGSKSTTSDPQWSFAIGNLDADPELEILGKSQIGIWIWNGDGTIVAHSDQGISFSAASIGELDGDPAPEIVLDFEGGLLGFEADLSPLVLGGGATLLGWGSGYSLADMDGDGIHDLLSGDGGYLAITRTNGVELALYRLEHGPSSESGNDVSPMVADIDGDGLSEIVVGDATTSRIVALENDEGGWAVLGGDHPWFEDDYHPDRLGPDNVPGRIDPGAVAAGHNVWNGRPVEPPQCTKAVTLEIRDVCVDRCDQDGVLTVYAINHGVLPVSSVVSVELVVDGEVRESVPLPEIEGERSVPVSMVVRAQRLADADAIEVRLSGPIGSECTVPSATWDTPVCAASGD